MNKFFIMSLFCLTITDIFCSEPLVTHSMQDFCQLLTTAEINFCPNLGDQDSHIKPDKITVELQLKSGSVQVSVDLSLIQKSDDKRKSFLLQIFEQLVTKKVLLGQEELNNLYDKLKENSDRFKAFAAGLPFDSAALEQACERGFFDELKETVATIQELTSICDNVTSLANGTSELQNSRIRRQSVRFFTLNVAYQRSLEKCVSLLDMLNQKLNKQKDGADPKPQGSDVPCKTDDAQKTMPASLQDARPSESLMAYTIQNFCQLLSTAKINFVLSHIKPDRITVELQLNSGSVQVPVDLSLIQKSDDKRKSFLLQIFEGLVRQKAIINDEEINSIFNELEKKLQDYKGYIKILSILPASEKIYKEFKDIIIMAKELGFICDNASELTKNGLCGSREQNGLKFLNLSTEYESSLVKKCNELLREKAIEEMQYQFKEDFKKIRYSEWLKSCCSSRELHKVLPWWKKLLLGIVPGYFPATTWKDVYGSSRYSAVCYNAALKKFDYDRLVGCIGLGTKKSVAIKILTNSLLYWPVTYKLARSLINKTNLGRTRWALPISLVGSVGLNVLGFGAINHYAANHEFNRRCKALVDLKPIA